MSILFLTNSLLTSVQDLGRYGFRSFGINPTGAMDKKAARLINILLDNPENEAVLEIHFPAPKIQFEENALIAVGGADFSAQINDQEIENWRPVYIEKNHILSFPKKISGQRIYLSVKGGFKLADWLNSKSTNLKAKIGGFEGRKVEKGDRLFFNRQSIDIGQKLNFKLSRTLIPIYSRFPTVRVIAGAEWDKLTETSQNDFLAKKFSIGNNSDRMGFRLNSEELHLDKNFELLSSVVNFGTIQLLPNGNLIILMADHQTTGGYPRIAHIISEDLPLVAQLGTNDNLYFQMTSLEEAENLFLEFEIDLSFLRLGVKAKGL